MVSLDNKGLSVQKLKLRMEGLNSKLRTEQCNVRGLTGGRDTATPVVQGLGSSRDRAQWNLYLT